jgi:hypothetical protein
MMSRRGLQLTLAGLGTIAVVFGLQGVCTGVAGVLDRPRESGSATDELGEWEPPATVASRNVDSEMRFFAAWYAGGGVLLLRSARRPETEAAMIRGLCGVLLVSASGRLISMVRVGAPHPLFRFLMGVEFAIPAVIVPWQARVARHAAPQN